MTLQMLRGGLNFEKGAVSLFIPAAQQDWAKRTGVFEIVSVGREFA
jgi:hypothetical protein